MSHRFPRAPFPPAVAHLVLVRRGYALIMNEASISKYITDTLAEVETAENFGYTFFFYKSDHKMPFATLASSDNDYDRSSKLDRPGVFRLNVGVSKQTFQSLFGPTALEMSRYDFTELDTIMPHPDYAAQHFICVLSPTEATFQTLRPMIAEAYDIAKARHAKRKSE